ncbi:MAG: type II secretion system protein [Bacilli bacterium]|nr:type II secretion system protein [Bacilli bacterium]
MKRLNNNGFTLVELLATVSIMAILMIIAVPNILNTVDKNKRNTYIEDARKLVLLAEHKFQFMTDHKPEITDTKASKCVGIIFNNLVKESEINKGPEGGDYNTISTTSTNPGSYSYVIISYDEVNKKYSYAVQLVETYKTKSGTTSQRGISLIKDSSDLIKENVVNDYIKNNKKHTFIASSNTTEIKKITGCSTIYMDTAN